MNKPAKTDRISSVRSSHHPRQPRIVVEKGSGNPHFRIYNINDVLLPKGYSIVLSDGCDFDTSEVPGETPIATRNLVQLLWAIDGVECVDVFASRIEVTKGLAFHWNSIHPKIINGITAMIYGCTRSHVQIKFAPLDK